MALAGSKTNLHVIQTIFYSKIHFRFFFNFVPSSFQIKNCNATLECGYQTFIHDLDSHKIIQTRHKSDSVDAATVKWQFYEWQ